MAKVRTDNGRCTGFQSQPCNGGEKPIKVRCCFMCDKFDSCRRNKCNNDPIVCGKYERGKKRGKNEEKKSSTV